MKRLECTSPTSMPAADVSIAHLLIHPTIPLPDLDPVVLHVLQTGVAAQPQRAGSGRRQLQGRGRPLVCN